MKSGIGRGFAAIAAHARGALVAAFMVSGTLMPPPAAAQVTLDLRDADLRSFVEVVSEATGRRFVVDPAVRGTVTVLAPDEMNAAELYEVFLSVLEINRLALIEGAGADRIVAMNGARELASGAAASGGTGAYETRVIEVRHVPLTDIVEVVRPLLPAEAVLTPLPGSNLLILSDRGQNFQRISALIARLDQPRELPVQMIQLSNANAAEVAQVVESMEILPAGAAISVDRRSNAIVLSAPMRVIERVQMLVARLDTQQDNVVSRAVPLAYADAAALADVVLRAIESQSSEGATQAPVRIVPEPQTNTLLISAPQERIADIVAMIGYLDKRPRQVLVEAVIFEMSVSAFSDLSVQWAGILDSAIVGGAQFSLGDRPSLTSLVSSVLNGETADAGSGGVLAGLPDGDTGVAGFLAAIASQTSTRLLSTPSIVTLNNQEAEIVVAQNVPFVTGAYSTVGNSAVENPFQTVERQDVGLTLTVTPQINADRTVKMAIQQEVSNLTSAQSSAGGEITSKRALSTTVLVRDGHVILLGGLLENGSGAAGQAVPGLSDLPLVGGLFRSKNTERAQRVLLVLLRPQVVETEDEARRMTRHIAAKSREASRAISPLNAERGPRTPAQALPFDGVDLNQPFDAGFVDDVAQRRNYPPLPSRLRFPGD
ncbi:type II secretion system secretin GspD [Salipiger aestuarii]|uniref:type II secretion system secretin GspD n=1 Tax=Salipiger aestuarii TaxID=568098 RepID=UPI0012393C2E|nr:type II secretion system secretin GspD [Salipiger aestuarii]KAA8609014.1 general secretion pathway protein GspD [Salipiger aestuarii]